MPTIQATKTESLKKNKGFDLDVIEDYRSRIITSGNSFVLEQSDDNSDECAHFYFIGLHEGSEVIYDSVIYTLRLEHESELLEVAEHRAAKRFPNYKKISYDEDENGNLEALDDQEEEIGLYLAEVIMELEENDEIKVREHVTKDLYVDFGIAIDIALHVETITPKVINKFIEDFNSKRLKLDTTLYSFQTKSDEAL